jgi:hypothetical protein
MAYGLKTTLARVVTNYIGDDGWLRKLSWRNGSLATDEIISQVPYLKGKNVTGHGQVSDCLIGKAYVTKKYIAYEVSLDEKGVKGNRTKKADTLIDLALQMDVDPVAFVAAVERHNRFCNEGKDQDFGKKVEYLKPVRKPPFYAFWGQRFTQCTHGGILVNNDT